VASAAGGDRRPSDAPLCGGFSNDDAPVVWIYMAMPPFYTLRPAMGESHVILFRFSTFFMAFVAV